METDLSNYAIAFCPLSSDPEGELYLGFLEGPEARYAEALAEVRAAYQRDAYLAQYRNNEEKRAAIARFVKVLDKAKEAAEEVGAPFDMSHVMG